MSLPIKIDLPEGFLDEEVRCGYTVTHEMKKVWAVELDLLNEFQKICKKYNIKYMASGGTMLGAVRHNGYIPWDDDIDLYVMRDDYDKLESIMNQELKNPYFWQTEDTDIGSVRGHAQLRNSKTTAILYSEKEFKFNFNQGIFIDIFPVDKIPDKNMLRFYYFSKLKILKKLSNAYSYATVRTIKKGVSTYYYLKALLKIFAYPLASLTKSKNFFYKYFEKTASKYFKLNTEMIGEVMVKPGSYKTLFTSTMLDELEMHDFEFLKVPIPTLYDKFLTNQYGDWQEIKHSNSTHGDTFFDANLPYTKYIG